MKIIIKSQESSSPIELNIEDGPERSNEAFPRYNSLITLFGTRMHVGVNSFKTEPKFIEVCKKIKAYCNEHNWELVKEEDSAALKTLWTTFIQKDTSDYKRPRAKTETWITVEGVPVCFLEYDEYRNRRTVDNQVYEKHIHYISAHVFLRKPGQKRIFTKQIITKAKLYPDRARQR